MGSDGTFRPPARKLFVESEDVRDEWADRSGEYSPEYYAYYGPDDTTETILEAVQSHLGPDPAILEVGSSSGRHLAALQEAGYDDLTGVEVNEDAREVMTEQFPALAETGTFHYDSIESVIEGFETDQFDAVFAVETLQHLHPDSEWVFAELARVTGRLLITVENEGEEPVEDPPAINYVDGDVPLYYRDWKRIFTDLGLDAVAEESGPRDTIRIFRA